MKHGGMTHRRVFYIWMMKVLMWISAGLTTLLVLFLIGYVFIKGLPNISFELLTTSPSYLADRIGILPDILNFPDSARRCTDRTGTRSSDSG